MESVLKKALDEAFTAKWAAELDDCEDTGYVFAPAIELEMKRNVKKARHPITFYTNYIAAAAACAVIAVGAAVAIPLLNSNTISVDENITDVIVSETTVDTEEATVTVSTGAEIAVPEEENDDVDDNAVGVVGEYVVTVPTTEVISGADDAVTDESGADTTATAENTTAPVKDIIEKDPEPPSFEQADYGPGNVDNDWPDFDNPGKGVDITDENDEFIAADECDSDDADYEYDEDDDSVGGFITIGDDDANPAMGGGDYNNPGMGGGDDTNPATGGGDYDNDDVGVDDDEESDDIIWPGSGGGTPSTEVGTKNKFPEANTLGELFTKITPEVNKSSLTVYNANMKMNGKGVYSLYPFGSYMNDFIRGNLNAKYSTDEDNNVLKCITMTVYDAARPQENRVLLNYSDWLHYNENYFYSGVISDDDDDDDVTDDVDDDYAVSNISFSAVISVYDNGYIFVTSAVDHKSGKQYSDVMRFKADKSLVDKLFANAEKTLLSESVSTAGELKDVLNITPSNVVSAYMSVNGIYDTTAYSMRVSGAAIAELFRENSGSQLYRSINNSGRFADCNVVLSDPSTELRINITSDRCIVTLYDNSCVMFALNEGSFDKFFSAAGRENNMSIPIYKTLADFVADKNFKTAERIFVRNKDSMYLAGESAHNAIMNAVREETPNAVYGINMYRRYSEQYVCINIKGWRYDRNCEFRIYPDDTVQIASNVFKASTGFYNKIKKLILESEGMSTSSFTRSIYSGQSSFDSSTNLTNTGVEDDDQDDTMIEVY